MKAKSGWEIGLQSYQNHSINAIKFYYEQILGRPVRTFYIQRPKKEKILPNVLSGYLKASLADSTARRAFSIF